jgi:hypothetical protein
MRSRSLAAVLVLLAALPAAARAADEPEIRYRRIELRHCVVLTPCELSGVANLIGAPDLVFEAVAAIVAGPSEAAAAALEKPKIEIRIFCDRADFQRYARADRPAFTDFGGYATSKQIAFWRQDALALDYRRLAHEMVHALLARSVDDAPWWLHEGLARDVSSFRYRPLNFSYSPFLDREAEVMLEAHRAGNWIPLEKLLSLGPRDLYAEEDTEERKAYRRLAYAEAWALVYYIRREKSLKRKKAFDRYLGRLREGAKSVGAFRETFDADLGAFEKRWTSTLARWRREHKD